MRLLKRVTAALIVYTMLCCLPAPAAKPYKEKQKNPHNKFRHNSKKGKLDFELKYTAAINNIPAGVKHMRIWIPYPQSDENQEIFRIKINSAYTSHIYRENEHGNKFLYFEIANPPAGNLEIGMEILARRFAVTASDRSRKTSEFPDRENPNPALYLAGNLDKTADIAYLKKITGKLLKGKKTHKEKIRALYEYVYKNIDYSKDVPGYGTGDVSRVCNVGSGNCVDFHSLFVALASTAGIIAREVGNIDVPLEEGTPNYCKANYHCSAEVYVPGSGWFPVDISHAKKGKLGKKEAKEFYYGSLDNLRLKIGHGRNVLLAKHPGKKRLNRLLHRPYVEIDDKEYPDVSVSAVAHRYDNTSKKSYGVIIGSGDPARPFKAEDLDGNPIDLDSYLGKKTVVINFFATWCGRCKWETPSMVKVYKQVEGKNIEFIRINVMEKKEKADAFRKKYNIPFPVIADEKGAISRLYGIKYVPANIIIDKKGIVRFAGNLLDKNDLEKRLKRFAMKKNLIIKSDSRMAFSISPNIFLVLILYKNQSRYNEAVSILKQMIDKEKNNQALYMELCDIYLKQKQYNKAGEFLETIKKRFPDSTTVKNFYAYFLALRNKELEKALKLS
ncbi:MAG: redoxin domain-containing protein, partial [bacterium]|nr:redoxin domain-containing protein [bacterium]